MQDHEKEVESQVGQLLRTLRMREGLQGKEVAKRVGVAPSTLTQWEHGDRRPRDLGQVVRLLEVLNAREQERAQVLTGTGFPPVPTTVEQDEMSGVVRLKLEVDAIASLTQDLCRRLHVVQQLVDGMLVAKPESKER